MALNKSLLLIIFLILTYFLIKFIKNSFLSLKRLNLPDKLKHDADYKFKNLIKDFEIINERRPNKKEAIWIAIQVSHIYIRQKGLKGHVERQKLRKYLLEKNKIINEYIMR